jgi:hypothetical protein
MNKSCKFDESKVCFFLYRAKYSHTCKSFSFFFSFFKYVSCFLFLAYVRAFGVAEWLSLLHIKKSAVAHISISKRTRYHSSVGKKMLIGYQPAPIAPKNTRRTLAPIYRKGT